MDKISALLGAWIDNPNIIDTIETLIDIECQGAYEEGYEQGLHANM